MVDDTDAGDWPDEYEMQSEAVKDCAESVFNDNPDLSKSQAFAICQDMDNKGQLTSPDSDQTDREQDGSEQPFRALADAEVPMNPPGPVSRIEQEDGSVRYKNLCILSPGEWVDGETEEAIFYSPELSETIAGNPAERVVRNQVNLDHENRDQLKRVGHFDDTSFQTDKHGNLYTDVILHRRTTHSKDTAGLMDLALETDGQQGAGGPSVEIPFENEVIEWDDERQMDALVGGDLSGLAIVTDSASIPTAFEEQFPNRAVAMSTSATAQRVLSSGQTALNESRHAGTMSDSEYRELKSDIESIQETVDDLVGLKDQLDTLIDSQDDTPEGGDTPEGEGNVDPDADPEETDDPEAADPEAGLGEDPEEERELQDFETVDQLLQQYMSEVEGDTSVAEFVSWASDNEQGQPVEDVVSIFMNEVDADDPAEVPAEQLMQFIQEQGGNSEDEETEEDMEMSDVVEEMRQLRAEVDEIKSQPQPPTEFGEEANGGGDERALDHEATPHRDSIARRGEYISR